MEGNDTNSTAAPITRWVVMRGGSAIGHPMYRSQAYALDSHDNVEAAMEAARVAADEDVAARLRDDANHIQRSMKDFGERVAPAAAPEVMRGVFTMVDETGEMISRRGTWVMSRQNSISISTRTVFWVEGRR